VALEPSAVEARSWRWGGGGGVDTAAGLVQRVHSTGRRGPLLLGAYGNIGKKTTDSMKRDANAPKGNGRKSESDIPGTPTL